MVSPPRVRPAWLAALSLLLLPACAPIPGKPDPRDPWERVNRTTYKVNDALDKAIARPVARTYRKVTPQAAQTGVTNFFSNLMQPETVVNDVLQGKPVMALRQLTRLIVNSTIGLAGLLDPAAEMGLENRPQDFGLTFGHWGIRPGPYLVLPLLGPSDLRDGVGLVPEEYVDPVHYIGVDYSEVAAWTLRVVRLIDERAHLLDEQSILDRAFDPYAFLRNAYLARRQFLITGESAKGKAPADAISDEELQEAEKSEEAEHPSSPSSGPTPPGAGATATPAPGAAPDTASPATPAAPGAPPGR